MADALDSKSSVRKDVWVRLPPLVLIQLGNIARTSQIAAGVPGTVPLNICDFEYF